MWISLTEADVLTKISGPELASFRAVVLASGQPDPVAEIISQTVQEVRGYVAGCLRNILGPDDTIPDKLKKAALALIVLDIMSRAGGKIVDLNGQRKHDADKAIELLRDVAACKFAVDLPETPSDEIIAIGTPSFNDNGRVRKFRDQTGL